MAKKKKKKVVLIIILIAVFVLIILPPALVFAFLYDGSTVKVTYDETFTTEKWSQSLVMDSLDDAASEGVAKFSITENDINNMIYNAYKDNSDIKQYLKQIAVDIKDNSYLISATGKFYFFETRAKISTTLEKTMMPKGGSEEEAYVFTITSTNLGRLPNMKGLIISLLKNIFGDSLSSSIDAGDIKLNIDLDNAKFYVYSSDFRNLINNAIPSDGGSTSFYSSFINDFLDNKLLEIDFYDNDAITIKVLLNKLTGNDYGSGQYVCYNAPYDSTTTKLTINGEQKKLSLDVIRDALVSLLNDGLIEENQMNAVSDYLFNGYDGSNAPSCSLESIGINDKTAYAGFNFSTLTNPDAIVVEDIASFTGYDPSATHFDFASIKESDLNAFLQSQKIFGNKFFLTRELDEGGYKASYIALDNAYINLTSDGAILTVGLNINGLETTITIIMDIDSSNTDTKKLVFSVSDLYYGKTDADGNKIATSNEAKSVIFSTLKSAVNNDAFSFTNDGKFTIDFNKVISDAINQVGAGQTAYKEFLTNHAEYAVSVVGDSVEDNSSIKITANRI